ncbi:hypothetical protein QU481_03790 [Crenobacter sp. SG2303]|uniref:Secreted protein n=1 Tax=Crenobacter oryzisoli TaxID=3056844 RepID=A0ABT7XJP5_9NEIS|nr:hypothetical protein [Crenobacter sp. SG2303]MDN0074011.1 hypothetical protein [Crenobacter sp. SG2303]
MYTQFFQLSRLVIGVLGATTVTLAMPCRADSSTLHKPTDALASLTRIERMRRLGPPSVHATERPSVTLHAGTPHSGRLQPTALWPNQKIILSASLKKEIGRPLG